MSVLNFTNVSFSYDNSKEILNNVNLNINEGDFIGLVGENGSGKSTLLKLILGQIKPSSGKIVKDNNLKIGCLNPSKKQ